MIYIKNNKKGFSIFVALMLTAIVTAVAYGVSTIGQKELIFVRAGIGSHKAYLSAENGMNCVQKYLFMNNSPFTFVYNNTSTHVGSVPIKCTGINVIAQKNFASNTGTVVFDIDSSIARSCAKIVLSRVFDNSGTLIKNIAVSRGYNVPCTDINTDSQALERGVRREF